MSAKVGLVLSAVLAAACSTEVDAEEDAAEVETRASLTFDAKGGESATGELTVGSKVDIVYDAARLTQCRGDKNGGGPGWTITGHYRIAKGETRDLWIAGFSPTGKTDKPSILLDAPGDLEIWFENTSLWGCDAFDSDYGKNYHFNVTGSVAQATLKFGTTGAPSLTGDLKAPGYLTVEYDENRLTTCRGSSANGGLGWRISGFAQLNDEKPISFTAGGLDSQGSASVPIRGKGKLSIWFENRNVYGCGAYDSNNGANYVFDVK